jgi:hypothetical protein
MASWRLNFGSDFVKNIYIGYDYWVALSKMPAAVIQEVLAKGSTGDATITYLFGTRNQVKCSLESINAFCCNLCQCK